MLAARSRLPDWAAARTSRASKASSISRRRNGRPGRNDVDKLLNYLTFDTQSQPGCTVIHVSGSGGFHADASGHSDSTGCADQQHIVLSNVDLRSSLGLDVHANDQQIIAELMQRGKLLVDNH